MCCEKKLQGFEIEDYMYKPRENLSSGKEEMLMNLRIDHLSKHTLRGKQPTNEWIFTDE